MPSGRSAPQITFLLGKRPKPSTIFPEVFQRLSTGGASVTVQLPHDGTVSDAELASADLIVHRGLDAAATAIVERLHQQHRPLINAYPGSRILQDRQGLLLALEGIPTPPTRIVDSWPAVLELAGHRRCVVKAAGGAGRGSTVVTGTAETLAAVATPLEPPYLVQDFVTQSGLPADRAAADHKLYVIADTVRGLLKPSPLAGGHTTEGRPFTPSADLVELALRVRDRLGLDFLGVDVLISADGPLVIDVNDFPSYRGVADAPALVAQHLLARSAGTSRRSAHDTGSRPGGGWLSA